MFARPWVSQGIRALHDLTAQLIPWTSWVPKHGWESSTTTSFKSLFWRMVRLRLVVALRLLLHSRPADLLVPNWSVGRPATFDLSVMSLLNSKVFLQVHESQQEWYPELVGENCFQQHLNILVGINYSYIRSCS